MPAMMGAAATLTRAGPPRAVRGVRAVRAASRLARGHAAAPRRSAARCGWGDDVQFAARSVVAVGRVGPYTLLRVEAPEEAKQYTAPGQYVQMRMPGSDEAAFLAIASAPDGGESTVLEFLIKPVEGKPAGALCAVAEGDEVEMSPPAGKGFALAQKLGGEPADVPMLLLLSTGSGLAPLRALCLASQEHGGLRGSGYPDVRLVHGARSAAEIPFVEDLQRLHATGLEVTSALSTEGASVDFPYDFGTFEGYVQEAIAEAGDDLELDENCAAVVIGQKEMFGETAEVLGKLGVPKERLVSNF